MDTWASLSDCLIPLEGSFEDAFKFLAKLTVFLTDHFGALLLLMATWAVEAAGKADVGLTVGLADLICSFVLPVCFLGLCHFF